MVRRSSSLGAFLLLALLGARSLPAAPINFTGNVANDFPVTAGSNVVVTGPDAVMHATTPSWMTAAGLNTGMDFQGVRMSYDKATDTLSVGIKFNGIGGDIDGNGVVGSVDPRAAAAGTYEPLSFGNSQTVALGFDFNKTGSPNIVVGIPVVKPTDPTTGKPETGVQAFTIAQYNPNAGGLPSGFGSSTVGSVNLLDHLGAKSVQTSASSPDVEFQITGFSQVAKLFKANFDPAKDGLGVIGFSGDIQAPMIGKSVLSYGFPQLSPQEAPEPATLLAWSIALGAAVAWGRHRRSRMA